MIVAVFGEEAVVGHVHACQHVLAIHGRREALLKALFNIIDSELVIKHGPPPEECRKHFDFVMENTLKRRVALIKACNKREHLLGKHA